MKKAILMLVVLALTLSGCMLPPQPQTGEDGEAQELIIDSHLGEFNESSENPASDEIDIFYESFYVLRGDFPLALYLAELKNVGTVNSAFTLDKVNLLNEAGEVLETISQFSTKSPSLLAPGESGYVTVAKRLDQIHVSETENIHDIVLDYSFAASDQELPDISHLSISDLSLNQTQASLEGVVHNNSSQRQKRVFLVVYLKDADGRLLVAETIEVKNIPAEGEKEFQSSILTLDPEADYDTAEINATIFEIR